MLKTPLAKRILKTAAEGERNRERLREAALRDLANEKSFLHHRPFDAFNR